MKKTVRIVFGVNKETETIVDEWYYNAKEGFDSIKYLDLTPSQYGKYIYVFMETEYEDD